MSKMTEHDKKTLNAIKDILENNRKEIFLEKCREVNHVELKKGDDIMSDQVDPRVPPMPSQDQEAITVTPEVLLGQIVTNIGPEFVVIPTDGWFKIVQTLQESSDEELIGTLEALKIPVVPVSLAPKEEQSPIIMPNDVPQGESRIIKP